MVFTGRLRLGQDGQCLDSGGLAGTLGAVEY